MALNLGTLFLRVSVRGTGSLALVERQMMSTQRAATSLAGAFGVLAGALAVREYMKLSDAYVNLSNRIKLTTSTSEEFAELQEQLTAAAIATGSDLSNLATIYQRVAAVGSRYGKTTKENIDITESLAKAAALSGSTAQEAGGALRQFSQALANNFRSSGQELNSLNEQAFRVSKAIADGLEVPIDQLKVLAEQGKLSSEEVLEAFQSQIPKINKEFGDMRFSFSQTFNQLSAGAATGVGKIEELLTGMQDLKENAQDLAKYLASDEFAEDIVSTFLYLDKIVDIVGASLGAFVAKMENRLGALGDMAREVGKIIAMPLQAGTAVDRIFAIYDQLERQILAIGDAHQETMARIMNGEASLAAAVEKEMEAMKAARDEARKSADDASEDTGKKIGALEGHMKSFATTMENTLGEGLKDALNGNFDSIEDGFKNMIQNMIVEAMAADIMGAMGLGTGSAGGSDVVGFGSAVLGGGANPGGGLAGLITGGMGMLGFAKGGNPPVNRPSLVGEEGPEVFVPRSSGTIIPNGAMGGTTNNITLNVPLTGGESDGAIKRSAAQLAREMKRELARV